MKEDVNRYHPAKALGLTFITLIVVGSFLLALPISTNSYLPVIDVFFTSASAVCVTGLTTVDVSTTYTFFGKLVILLLIQVGGLGMMTFTAVMLWLLRQRISLSDRMTLQYSLVQDDMEFSLRSFIFFIIKYTFVFEAIGAFCFFFALDVNGGIWNRIFFSLFHSVSAFCNAGFSLYSDSFVRYSDSIFINVVTMSLIFLGGIGFVVVFELKNIVKRIFVKKGIKYCTNIFSLHSWTVINFSIILIISGMVLIYGLEHLSHTSDMTLLEALFQSVTCRTAGFNTVNVGFLDNSTLLIMTLLMFIGGSPGSTAGGIKTTTFAVLIFVAFLSRNNFEEVTAKNRTIPKTVIYQAFLVFLFSCFIIFSATVILAAIEKNITFILLFFECVSAFGTVGLSTGVTEYLSTTSKIVLILVMFFGRVGSIAIFSIFLNRVPMQVKNAEERILVG